MRMVRVSHFQFALVILLGMGLMGWSVAQTQSPTQDFVKIKPPEVKWGNAGANGLQVCLLVGDPSKPGPYMMRVKFPPGVMTRPHTHPNDRFVTVISGTWYAGIGEKFEPDKTDPMPAGSFMIHPANRAHYDGAKAEEVIVQISGMGPAPTQYINPADDPSRRKTP